MATLTFAPRLSGDLRDIGDWIARDNPDRAVTFIEEILATCDGLTDFPLSNPPFPRLGPKARRRNHGSYAIFYEVSAAGVIILAVVHAVRDLDTLDIR